MRRGIRSPLSVPCPTELVEQGRGESMLWELGARSRRRCDLPAVLPLCIHELRETPRTEGVRKTGIGHLHAMGLSIRPRRDPALTIRGRSGLVPNLTAETTDMEQGRSDDRFSHGSVRRLTSGLSDLSFTSHTAPPSFTRQTGASNAAMR